MATTIGDSLGRTSYLCFYIDALKPLKIFLKEKLELYYKKIKQMILQTVNDVLFQPLFYFNYLRLQLIFAFKSVITCSCKT